VVDVVPEHVQAINEQGLLVDGVAGEFRVSIPASLPEQLTGPLDVVLIAVKSAHTDSAVDVIEPHLNDRSLVISLQNGLNPDRIAARLGKERVAGGFINFAADYIAPGHIRYGGVGDYYLGPVDGSADARLKEIASKFDRIMNTVLTDNIMGYLWSKECYGSLLIGTALIDAPVHEILVAREHREVLAAAVAEAVEVADASGVTLEDFEPFQAALFRAPLDWPRLDVFFDRVADRFQKRVKQHTGIWRDLRVRRRKTEVDWLTGEVIRRGETLGLDLPVNRKIVAMIREIENGQREQDWSNLQEIHAGTIGAARPA
jgi:2-dehydropantoate 2-reductase